MVVPVLNYLANIFLVISVCQQNYSLMNYFGLLNLFRHHHGTIYIQIRL